MIVACKVKECYYYDRGFCAKNVVAIDENGMCDEMWFRGQHRRPLSPLDRQPRVEVKIQEAKVNEN